MLGSLVTAAAVTTATGWVDWSALWTFLQPHLVVLALGIIAAILIGTAVVRAVPRRWWPAWLARPDQDQAVPPLSWWAVAAAVFVVAAVAWGATSALLHEANHALDPAATRVDAIKTGFSIAAGAGGVFALLLAVRRQWHQELTATASNKDAVERRITELFTKAVEQTGSDEAPVRLGGLYSLERIAQDYEQQRRTIVEVICAYLRAPYPDLDKGAFEETVAQQQERHVRLAALSILVRHLRPGVDFWPRIELKLSRAVLFDADFRDCRIEAADFRGARFAGPTRFDRATFDGRARFTGATFHGETSFREVTFTRSANFTDAVFEGDVMFSATRFGQLDPQDMARFDGARFSGTAGFAKTVFEGYARFGGTEFAGGTWFSGATFQRTAGFGQATFGAAARFDRTEFFDYARFDSVVFDAETLFVATRFADDAWFNAVRFGGMADFREAAFGALVWFGYSEFGHDAVFDRATPRRTVWFGQARFHGEARFDGLVFPANTGFDEAVFHGTTRPATMPPPSTEGTLDLLSVTPRRVFLVGLMGSGKSTIGTELAALLGWEYLDNDTLLKKLTGFDAPELVKRAGMEGLWAEESRQLHELLRQPAPFIAGVAASVGDREHELRAMADAGHVIYLRTDPKTLAKRVGTGEGRPFLKDKDPLTFFQKQTGQRDDNYRTAGGGGAVHVVDTDDRDPRALAQELAAYLTTLDSAQP